MLFGDMVCTTLNMDHRKRRRGLSQEIRKKMIDKHVKGKGNGPIALSVSIALAVLRFKTVLLKTGFGV